MTQRTKKAEYMKVYMQTYRKKNKETVAKSARNWQEKNKEHLKLYMREYRARKKAEQEALKVEQA